MKKKQSRLMTSAQAFKAVGRETGGTRKEILAWWRRNRHKTVNMHVEKRNHNSLHIVGD